MGIPEPIRMTAEEFFETIPETNQRIELIDGEVVYQAAPTEQHQDIVLGISADLRSYIRKNGGTCKVMMSPFDVKLDDRNVVRPDVLVICDPSKRDGKRCNGAPDFVIEVLSTNRKTDLLTKLALYQEHGVREYWIVDPVHEKTLVYFFEKSDLPNLYTFDTPIPVGIYDGALSICIAELL